MTIKHLVIAGGGPLGFRFIGALKRLEETAFWERKNIKSIYGTSAGSIIGAIICLNYDWDTLTKYVIERPWHSAFKLNARQIFDSYYNKGLFDKKFMEIIFKPLLDAKDLSLNITLAELYAHSNIDLHIFTFDLNKFETVELSHETHPQLSLTQALTMSSALPGLFMPIIMDKCCFVDGGILANYPISYCLNKNPDTTEILGIKSTYDDKTPTNNVLITEESSLLEYVSSISINTINYLKKNIKAEHILNTVTCSFTESPIKLETLHKSILSQEFRQELYATGAKDADEFLEARQ
jgi:predicted acylesterase/phospholipase RssA